MSDKSGRPTRRPRLDAGARERLLAEIARIERGPDAERAARAREALHSPEPKPPHPPTAQTTERQQTPAQATGPEADAPKDRPRRSKQVQREAQAEPRAAAAPPPPAKPKERPSRSGPAAAAPQRSERPPAPARERPAAGQRGAAAKEALPQEAPATKAPPPDRQSRSERPPPRPPKPKPEVNTRGVPKPAAPAAEPDDDVWSALGTVPLDPEHLERNLVITASRADPAHGAFDVLRTRLVQALAEKGWRRVAITSPTSGCGKSFTAINLAITLSRYDRSRTVLMDMDMRRPGLSRYLGIRDTGAMGDYLRGLRPLEAHFLKPGPNNLHIGDNLALGLNNRPEAYAAELFQEPETELVLDDMLERLQPDVVLYDLPPALAQDDVIAFRPHFDCLIMVVGGGITSAEEVREATRRIGEDKPVLGVVLNKAEIEGDYDY